MKTFFALVLCTLLSYGIQAQTHDTASHSKNKPVMIAGMTKGEIPSPTLADRAACDILQTLDPEVSSPTGIAISGDEIWVCNGFSSEVYLGDGDGTWSVAVTLEGVVSGAEYHDCHLYVVAEQTAALYKVNVEDYSFTQFDLPTLNPSDPNVFGVTYGDDALWVSEYSIDGGSRIYKLDPETLESTDTLTVQENVLGLDWCDGVLYGINPTSAAFLHIDPSTGDISQSESWCVDWTYDLDFPNGNLWCISAAPSLGSGDIYEIDPGFSCASGNTPCGEVSIEELEGAGLTSVYPNPASTSCTIQAEEGAVIQILDAAGQLVYQSKAQQIDCSTWAPGLYTVRVEDASGMRTTRLIKE